MPRIGGRRTQRLTRLVINGLEWEFGEQNAEHFLRDSLYIVLPLVPD